ncbi:Type II inositol 1,4,5-trisphosphate 5-phosphatase [Merluccius polli]|uniref:phosphoinositide 5-phosphatase n=1 Tax=Merluccius polli TaxID=89951 RepID=A0AA47MRG8_MERPO|nr:Type II inositol 1,4,5-trisphosphate 5-phosphatase [Merluccius polli]
MDQSVAIQETLATEEDCITVSFTTLASRVRWACYCGPLQCTVDLGEVTESRLLGLVECAKEHALFIYTHRRMAITADDVSLEDIFPVSRHFEVVEVSSPDELAIVGADTRIRVSFQEEVLEVSLPFGSHSRFFLGELNKAWSDVCKSSSHVPKFEWLHKHSKTTGGQAVIKQSLTPLGAKMTKLSKQTAKALRPEKKGSAEEVPRSLVELDRSRGPPSPGSEGGAGREDRNDMVRSSSHTPANKAQMLSIPQFGLRDNLIRCELLKNEDQYTHLQDFSFFLATYNVNGQAPKESLTPWLSCSSSPPDVYCVGFQELDLSKEAFFFNDTPREPEWMRAVSEALHPDAKYALVKLVRLVGIMLMFYVKREHAGFISEVEAETVGTGIMGRMGNKGAVAIRFRFHNTDVCVVSSHLAAHIEEYERRNQDYREICSRLQFRLLDPGCPPLAIMKHNVVLWLGDLNYRISDLDVDHVKNLITKKDFETLHNYDQVLLHLLLDGVYVGCTLKRQMDEEAVFEGFVEGDIQFQPTYKYDTGSDDWDTSEKCRAPAWCDRILWRGKNIKQSTYQSHMTLKTSDHKPVSSLLQIGIKVVNEEAYKKKFEEIVRCIDKMENECIPSVTLSRRELHFQDVKYMEHQTESLTLFNDGQVPCQFEFIQKLDEPTYSKPWLTANPPKGFLAQGAQVDIDLEVFVNRSTAPDLNIGLQHIEDILVLHLERGKDYFLSVSGNYLASCYGTPISTLCQLREPIRDMPLPAVRALTKGGESPEGGDKPLGIPKEIWMMVDHLFRNAIKQEDLFQQPGLRSEFQEIRDYLDTAGSNHSVAEALLLFLESLPEPVVPYSFYQQCLDCYASATQSKKVISMLPQCHKNVFDYLAAFLRELLKNSDHNNLDVNILATIFAALLLRSPTKQDLAEKRKTQEFFQHFLVQDLS